MEFDDKPNFSIAAVTDWSGAGGHGSETGLRTTEALTRQTAALSSANQSKDVLTHQTKRSLREQREQIQTKLAVNNRPDLHRELGDIDERLNDPVAAEHEYEEAARLDPSEANYFSWGTELLLHRASAAAVEVFNKGVAAHPKSARMVAGLGAALYADGSIDQAVQRVCEASQMEPTRVEFYKLMADIEQTANSTPSCILKSLSRFATLQPSNASANYYYAVTLWKQERAASRSEGSEEPEKLLQKAIELDSHFGQAYLQLGIIHSESGHSTAAIKDFQSCVSVAPKLSECHYRLGLAYRRIGEEQKAKDEIQNYERAQATETAEIERQRSNLRQFLVVLKDQPSSVHQNPVH
jgi:tetratricopeptide (TPR) repeat protein